MFRTNILDLKVGAQLGAASSYDFQPVAIVSIVRITKTTIELSNGQKWRISRHNDWSRVGGSSWDRSFLTTVEDAQERNAALTAKRRFEAKVGRLDRIEFKWLPEEMLDQFIMVMDTYRQQSADAALEAFLITGKKIY